MYRQCIKVRSVVSWSISLALPSPPTSKLHIPSYHIPVWRDYQPVSKVVILWLLHAPLSGRDRKPVGQAALPRDRAETDRYADSASTTGCRGNIDVESCRSAISDVVVTSVS